MEPFGCETVGGHEQVRDLEITRRCLLALGCSGRDVCVCVCVRVCPASQNEHAWWVRSDAASRPARSICCFCACADACLAEPFAQSQLGADLQRTRCIADTGGTVILAHD